MRTTYFLSAALAAANIALPHTAVAEIWRCRSSDGSSILTNVPSSDSSTECSKIDLARIPFVKIPTEQFEQLGRVGQQDTTSTTMSDSVVRGSASATKNSPPKPATPHLKLDRTHGLKPSTSFEAKESASGRKGRRAEFDRRCEVRGTARSVNPGEGRIRIRRGALTVDEVAVHLGGDGKPVNWRASLAGACRNPEITVEAE